MPFQTQGGIVEVVDHAAPDRPARPFGEADAVHENWRPRPALDVLRSRLQRGRGRRPCSRARSFRNRMGTLLTGRPAPGHSPWASSRPSSAPSLGRGSPGIKVHDARRGVRFRIFCGAFRPAARRAPVGVHSPVNRDHREAADIRAAIGCFIQMVDGGQRTVVRAVLEHARAGIGAGALVKYHAGSAW